MKLVSLLFLAFTVTVQGQIVSLRGVVTDESGAVIPKANVAVTGPGYFLKREGLQQSQRLRSRTNLARAFGL